VRDSNTVTEPIFENRFVNLEFCCRKTVICQELLLADRSIAMTSRPAHWHSVVAPNAHKSKTNSRIIIKIGRGYTPWHALHRAPVSRSKVIVTTSHRLYVSSLPLLNSGNKMLCLCHYRRAGEYRVGRTRRQHFLF